MTVSRFLTRLRPYTGLIAGLGVLSALFFLSHIVSMDPRSDVALQKYAREVIAACKDSGYTPACYDKEIPKLMDKGITMEQAFQVTYLIQEQVPDYFYCHVLGHNLSAKETAKDPLQWTTVVARCPTGMCSNGCLHGAAQEKFRDDALSSEEIQALIPEIKGICQIADNRNFTGLEQASCYHAMGHLAMYISGAEIDVAIKTCDQVAMNGNQDFTQTCYEGSYMQIFQPLEPEDFALVDHIPAKTVDEAVAFCESFTGERRTACHRESWPLYRETLQDADGMEAFCSIVPDPKAVQRCYNAIFYIMTVQLQFDEDRIEALCEGFEEKRKGQCYANAASRMVETDYRLVEKATSLCALADTNGVGKRCYDELMFYSTFNFHEGSDAFKALCTSMPEPWRTSCLNGEGKNIHPSANDY